MKLPTSLLISSVKYKVTYSPKTGGGVSNLTDKVITIGTINKAEVLNILYHEAIESILHERGLRYTRYEEGNDGIRFVFTHHDYENIIADMLVVISALKDLKI